MELILTTEIKNKILALSAEKKSLEEIASILDIQIDDLKELFQKERRERLIRKAEKDSEFLLDIDLNDPKLRTKYTKSEIALMKVKQDESQFILETLAKDQGYSKRSELTGADGKEFIIKAIVFHPPVIPSITPKE